MWDIHIHTIQNCITKYTLQDFNSHVNYVKHHFQGKSKNFELWKMWQHLGICPEYSLLI